MSGEWFKVETSNLSCQLITRGSNIEKEKLGQTGRKGVYFLEFWEPLYISGMVVARNFKFSS